MYVQEQGHAVVVCDVADPRNPVQKRSIPNAGDWARALDDDRYLAISDTDNRLISFWDLRDLSGQVGRVPLVGGVSGMDVSDDGRYLGVATKAGTDDVQVWHVTDPTTLTAADAVTLPGQSEVALAPNDGTVVTEDSETAFGLGVRIWPADPNLMYQDICAEIGHLPLPADWSTYTRHLTVSAPCG